MKTILIFDQAESAGGSINRAVDLAEKLNGYKFIFLTFHPLKKLHSSTDCPHISAKRIFSFYNGKTIAAHNKWIDQTFKKPMTKGFLKSLIGFICELNKAFTIFQAILLTYSRKIDIVQANCGFHPLPYHLSKIKKAGLIYYFRDLQNYSAISPPKINCASHYVFVGNTIKEKYQAQLGLPLQKCFMVHSPFNVTNRLNKEVNQDLSLIQKLKDEGKRIIILPSRICEDKGQHIALAAVTALSKDYSDFALLIAGDADPDAANQAYLKRLLNYAKQHNIEKHVHFLGHRCDILHLIKNADITIHTAIYFEAMAGTLIESLQLGTPVVASNVGGTSEAIDNHRSGFLFEAGNHHELAETLLQILTGKIDLEPIITAGREHAFKNWSPENIQQKMEHIYLDAINYRINSENLS
jgi:glycosyltransferase involved in cell wall biosynthesis